MAKKYPPGYIKNPAKVAAGKARAAQGLKNQSTGKYLPKIFTYEINKALLANKGIDVSKVPASSFKKVDDLMKEAGVTKKQAANFYNTMPEAFESIIKRGTIKETPKNTNQLEKIFDQYKGKIIIQDGSTEKSVNSSEAKYMLTTFMQYMKVNANVVDMTIKPSVSIDGKMYLKIPDMKELVKKIKEYADLNSIKEIRDIEATELTEIIADCLADMYEQDSDDITIYSSDKAGKK